MLRWVYQDACGPSHVGTRAVEAVNVDTGWFGAVVFGWPEAGARPLFFLCLLFRPVDSTKGGVWVDVSDLVITECTKK